MKCARTHADPTAGAAETPGAGLPEPPPPPHPAPGNNDLGKEQLMSNALRSLCTLQQRAGGSRGGGGGGGLVRCRSNLSVSWCQQPGVAAPRALGACVSPPGSAHLLAGAAARPAAAAPLGRRGSWSAQLLPPRRPHASPHRGPDLWSLALDCPPRLPVPACQNGRGRSAQGKTSGHHGKCAHSWDSRTRCCPAGGRPRCPQGGRMGLSPRSDAPLPLPSPWRPSLAPRGSRTNSE